MADFASFKSKESSVPEIINLDVVATLQVSDNEMSDAGGEAYILFRRIVEPVFDEGGRKKAWFNQPSGELMVWVISVANTGKPLSEVKKIRDEVLQGLIGKTREFVVERMIAPPQDLQGMFH